MNGLIESRIFKREDEQNRRQQSQRMNDTLVGWIFRGPHTFRTFYGAQFEVIRTVSKLL